MSRKVCLLAIAVCALVIGAGFLVGCNASCGLGTDGKQAAADASGAIADAGDVISNVPGVGILGSLLKIAGGLGVAYFGTKAVASKEVKKEQDKDFTPEEALNMEKAKAVANLPKPS